MDGAGERGGAMDIAGAKCTVDEQCTQDPAKAFCVDNVCVGCHNAGSAVCAKRTDGKTICASKKSAVGQCVACMESSDCPFATLPICNDSNQCLACQVDSECTSKLGTNPGVCLYDGHCATDEETVYVGTIGTSTCSDTASNAGSAQTPYCTAQSGVGIAKSKSKPLVVMTGPLTGGFIGVSLTNPLTVVGKNAVITPAAATDGISINSGELYLRGLTIKGSASTMTGTGIIAQPVAGGNVALHMDTCVVANNPGGGILLNGAAFDIKNTTVSGNGPGAFGTLSTPWGGILVNNPPSSGSKFLAQVSLQNNQQVGMLCSENVLGIGVLSSGNTGGDIGANCGVTSCSPDGTTTCGAQYAP
jgi:hypothetical protein